MEIEQSSGLELRSLSYAVFSLVIHADCKVGCNRFHLERCGASTAREKMQSRLFRDGELRAFKRFMDKISPSREPTIRIYRLESLQEQKRTRFRKQTRVGEVLLSDFSHDPALICDYLRAKFGAGNFLLRVVRANGTYGPSRVVSIGGRREF